MGDLVRDLEAASEQRIETHISWVFLRSHDVFKLKKPVDFGFLDFTDLSSRHRACLAEVELNTRLAPGIYRGVVPVTRDADGQHALDGDGTLVDYAVHMTRLPEAARADVRLARAALGRADIDALAALLARFHAAAARGPMIDTYGRLDVIRRNVEENFEQASAALRALGPGDTERAEREVEERQLAFLERYAALFEERVRQGRICDGHGDLRLEHVYFLPNKDPVVIDCIEFNERFRYADVCADLAFLAMDLGWHGRVDLEERLLAAYAHATGDYDLYALVDFYQSYRAYVRAKVNALSLASSSLDFDAREKLEADTRRYLLLAQAAERPALAPPRLIAVGGLIASGKTTLARALGDRFDVPVISSDETRKQLLGVAPTTPLVHGAWQAAYSPEHNREVYAEVLRRARAVLASGRSVIVDASFRSRADRVAARRMSLGQSAGFQFVECRVPEHVARGRLAERARGPSTSDGRAEIYDDFALHYEAVTELEPGEHLRLDTTLELSESLAALERAGVSLPDLGAHGA